MKRLLFILLAFTLYAQQPYTPGCDQIVTHGKYTLCYSEKHEQAKWVSYTLEIESLMCKKHRKNDFRSDPLITTGSASVSDYRGSEYDRGHLAPAADFCDVSSTFFMSNMSPQKPRFNRGVWKRLEEWVRNQVRLGGAIKVVTGPVLNDNLKTIGKNKVSVPEFYYKVIIGDGFTIAFFIPNHRSMSRVSSFMVPIDSVEAITGIKF